MITHCMSTRWAIGGAKCAEIYTPYISFACVFKHDGHKKNAWNSNGFAQLHHTYTQTVRTHTHNAYPQIMYPCQDARTPHEGKCENKLMFSATNKGFRKTKH